MVAALGAFVGTPAGGMGHVCHRRTLGRPSGLAAPQVVTDKTISQKSAHTRLGTNSPGSGGSPSRFVQALGPHGGALGGLDKGAGQPIGWKTQEWGASGSMERVFNDRCSAPKLHPHPLDKQAPSPQHCAHRFMGAQPVKFTKQPPETVMFARLSICAVKLVSWSRWRENARQRPGYGLLLAAAAQTATLL